MDMYPAVLAIALLALAPFALVAVAAFVLGVAMSAVARFLRAAMRAYHGRL
jgi:hypothetical protein